MAKFLITSLPMKAHVNPVMPLASKLVKRGHEVAWYTGRSFQPAIEAIGASFAKMESAPDYTERGLDEIFPERKKLKGTALFKFDFKHGFLDAAVGQAKDLSGILNRFHADVIVTEILFFGSSLFSRKEWPPRVGVGFVPLGVMSRDTAPFGMGIHPDSSPLGRLRNAFFNWIARNMMFRDIQAYADSLRSSMGLPPLHRFFFDELEETLALHLQGSTPSFEYPRSDLPDIVHFIGPLLPALQADFQLPSWWHELKAGRPVVLVTQGTMDADHKKLIEPALEGLAGEDLLVVATTGKQDESCVLHPPANARIARYIPYDIILPHCDIMITNGGYGGVQFALRHGVPLIAAGATEEKPEICARISWAGVGIDLKTDKPAPEQIRRAVREVLSSSRYRSRAGQLKEEIAQYDAPTRAADLLEKLITERKAAAGAGLLKGAIAS